jgi:hypothetical protein
LSIWLSLVAVEVECQVAGVVVLEGLGLAQVFQLPQERIIRLLLEVAVRVEQALVQMKEILALTETLPNLALSLLLVVVEVVVTEEILLQAEPMVVLEVGAAQKALHLLPLVEQETHQTHLHHKVITEALALEVRQEIFLEHQVVAAVLLRLERMEIQMALVMLVMVVMEPYRLFLGHL